MENIETIGKGAIPREWDERNIIFSEIPAGAGFFDWKKGFDLSEQTPLKIENQNGSLSCVGQAWAKYAEVLEHLETKRFKDLSARFIYSRIYVPSGGAYIYKGAKVLAEIGTSSELTTPSYENGNPPSENFMRQIDERPETLSEAAIQRVKSHAYLNPSINEFALAIQNQNGLVTGFIGANEGWGSAFIRPPRQSEPTWGHAVYCVGAKLIEGKKYIKFINSWGKEWGENGYGYVGEDYFSSGYVFNAITLVDLPNDWQKEKEQPIFKHNFYRDIVFGERSEEVRALQKALKIDGAFPQSVPETGYYGEITRKAVFDFQKKSKVASLSEILFVKGRRAGAKTRSKLNQLFNQ